MAVLGNFGNWHSFLFSAFSIFFHTLLDIEFSLYRYEIHKKNYDISNTDNLAIKHNEIIQAMEEYNYNYNNIIDKAAADIAQKINEHLEQLQK